MYSNHAFKKGDFNRHCIYALGEALSLVCQSTFCKVRVVGRKWPAPAPTDYQETTSIQQYSVSFNHPRSSRKLALTSTLLSMLPA